jgi:Serine incorporator (Serinc)
VQKNLERRGFLFRMSRPLWLPRDARDSGYTLATICYGLLFIASTALAWTLRDAGVEDAVGTVKVCEDGLPGQSCFRKEAVLRVSAGSMIYLLAQLLAVLAARVGARASRIQGVCLAHGGAYTRKSRAFDR